MLRLIKEATDDCNLHDDGWIFRGNEQRKPYLIEEDGEIGLKAAATSGPTDGVGSWFTELAPVSQAVHPVHGYPEC